MWYRVGLACAAAISTTVAVGCGGAVDTTASGDPNTVGTYSAMLTCGDGEAVLEVDRVDARNAKLVVRGRGEGGSDLIVAGQTRLPVGTANEFDRFVDESGRFDRTSPEGTVAIATLGGESAPVHVVAEVRRGAVDTLTLSFQQVSVTRSCSGTIDGHFCRGGEWTEAREIKELSASSFGGCR